MAEQKLKKWSDIEKEVSVRFNNSGGEAELLQERLNQLYTAQNNDLEALTKYKSTIDNYNEIIKTSTVKTDTKITSVIPYLRNYEYKTKQFQNDIKLVKSYFKQAELCYKELKIENGEALYQEAKKAFRGLKVNNDITTYNEKRATIRDFLMAVRQAQLEPAKKELGEAFEAATAAMLKVVTDKGTEKLIEEVIQKGQTSVERNVETISLSDIEYDGTFISTKAALDKSYAKADLVIKIAEDSEPIGLSLKSWSRISDFHNFGETYLSYALTRLSGNGNALYGYISDYSQQDAENLWTNADKVASLALVYDTVIGLSQGDNKAKYIVIHNRSNSKEPIQVYSVKDILNTVRNNLASGVLVSSYNDFINNNKQEINQASLVFLSSQSTNTWEQLLKQEKLGVIPSYLGITS